MEQEVLMDKAKKALVSSLLDKLSSLKCSIDICIDEEGSIREPATLELKRLIKESQGYKEKNNG